MMVGSAVGLWVVASTTAVGAAPSGGALPPVLTQVLQIGGQHGVPVDASMVALNVTAVSPDAPGFLTVYPCDEDVPLASNVNYLAGEVAPNLALSRLALDGTVCIETLAVTDILVDIIGFVPAGSSITPVDNPERALDTRTQTVSPSPATGPSSFSYQLGGRYGIDPGADTVLFNLTAIGRSSPGFVTAWPCDTEQPQTSTVNYGPFEVSPNFVISRLAADGSVCFFTSAPADIVVDVAGYATGGFSTLARPERVHDSRLSGGARPAGTTLTLDVTERPDVPDDATAAIYNLTAVDAAAPGFATSHPCDVATPEVSNLNYLPGGAVANTTVTKLSGTGQLCVFNLTATNLIVDLIGYVRDAAQYEGIPPVRILDTREGWQRTCPWVVAVTPVSFFDARTTVTNVATGTAVVHPQFNGNPTHTPKPFVDADCTGYWYPEGMGRTTLRFTPFPGAADKPDLLPDASPPWWNYRGFGQLADGTIVGVAWMGEVVRVTDGAVLADLSVDGSVMQAEISAGGTVALRYGAIQSSTTTDRPHIEIRDLDTGGLIADLTVDRDTVAMDLSPSGTYLVLDRNVPSRSTSAVVNVTGGLVDAVVHPAIGSVRSHFWGDGSLLTCVEGIGVFQWDLFADPALIASASDERFFGVPLPGSNADRCSTIWA